MAPPAKVKKNKYVGQGSSQGHKWVLLGACVFALMLALAGYGAWRVARDGYDYAESYRAWEQEQAEAAQAADADSTGSQAHVHARRTNEELNPGDESDSLLAAAAKKRRSADEQYQAAQVAPADTSAFAAQDSQPTTSISREHSEQAYHQKDEQAIETEKLPASAAEGGLHVELPPDERFGYSSDGEVYSDPRQFWATVEPGQWYHRSTSYWDGQEASYNGVMLGYEHLHKLDIQDSRELLLRTYRNFQPGKLEADGGSMRALDVGAGVGRVTKELLLHYYGQVDLLEPSNSLLNKAKQDLKGKQVPGVPSGHRAVEFMHNGLQYAELEPMSYDAIWVQWCLMYMTDKHLTDVLLRLRLGLQPGGIIFVKENVAKQGFVVDKKDNSVTRSRAIFERYFLDMGLMVMEHGAQKGFPDDLYEVHMWALTRAPPTSTLFQREVDAHHSEWMQNYQAGTGVA